MYRPSRKRAKKIADAVPKEGEEDTGIKGPNSALTAFLKEQGISAGSIKDKWLESQQKKKRLEEEEAAAAERAEHETVDAEDEIVITKNGIYETIKMEGTHGSTSEEAIELKDSSEEDEDIPLSSTAQKDQKSRRERIEQESDSDEEEYVPSATRRTMATVATEEANPASTGKTLKQKNSRKRKAADLLDRRRSDKIRSLQELTILKISEQISKQETANGAESNMHNTFTKLRDVLGGISMQNFQQLSKTLCKNRSLNDDTLQLFLQTSLHSLEFGDCCKLSFQGYKTLAIFTPNLTHLSLQMCGQLNNESLLYLADHLKDLESIYLDGPFLINEETWIAFFEKMNGRLKSFKVSNTHRFTNACLKSLLENCGEILETIGLSRVDTISEFREIPGYVSRNLQNLSIMYPYNEDDVNDDMMIELVSKVGNLTELTLNGCSGLTDRFVLEGLCEYWDAPTNITLQILQLEELDQLEDESLKQLFGKIQFLNLKEISLKRCIELQNGSLEAIFQNSLTKSLQSLNINSLKNLTPECFNKENISFKELAKLNVSFVKAINDSVLTNLISTIPSLKFLEVFGCSRVTENFKVPPHLVLIGRESDTL